MKSINNFIIEDECEKIFHKLYCNYSLIETINESLSERNKKRYSQSNYVYGEVTYEGMKKILSYLQNNFNEENENKTFLDLGSGIGRAVVSAALIGNFRKSVGVEILENLHLMSTTVKELYDLYALQGQIPFKNKKDFPQIEFIREDFHKIDYSSFDVVFTNSTCWSEKMLKDISKTLLNLKKDSIVINTDHNICFDNKTWMRLKPLQINMSWGIAKTFICKKII